MASKILLLVTSRDHREGRLAARQNPASSEAVALEAFASSAPATAVAS